MTSKRKSYSLEDKKWVIEWIISEGDGIPTLVPRNSSSFLLAQFDPGGIQEKEY